jgi:hypothetical protein
VASARRPTGVRSPWLAGRCEGLGLEAAEDEPGPETVQDAMDAFVAGVGDLLANTTSPSQQSRHRVVGRTTVRSMPAGGYLVTSVEGCYPDDHWAADAARRVQA